MKRFLINYATPAGSMEYWCYAESTAQARVLFRNEWKSGNLDYETNGVIISISEG